jgi:hypothetical protein
LCYLCSARCHVNSKREGQLRRLAAAPSRGARLIQRVLSAPSRLRAPDSDEAAHASSSSDVRLQMGEPVAEVEVEVEDDGHSSESDGGGGGDASRHKGSALSGAGRRALAEQGDILTARGRLAEWAACCLLQFWPVAVTKEQYSLMRASFWVSNDSLMDPLAHLLARVELDFALVVGLGLEMWLSLILLVLLSGVVGWAAAPLLLLAAGLLLVVNAKLKHVIRHACRGGRVKSDLGAAMFWRARPELLLPPIKYVLFVSSAAVGASVFFAWQFGARSCFRSPSFYFAMPGPWWLVPLAAALLMLSVSAITLPMYSVAAHLGGGLKPVTLSPMQRRLLALARQARDRVRARAAEERRAAEAARAAEGVAGAVAALAGRGLHAGKALVRAVVSDRL